MKVLVTGGTGYLGRAIVRAAARHGHTPIVFARSASSSDLPGMRVDGDIRDRRALRDAARDCDAVCHSAALVSSWRARPRDFDDVNVGGLENVLAVQRELSIPRVVYTSSFLALPPTGHHQALTANDYQRTKVDARRRARAAIDRGAPIVCLYPGVVYGPGVMTEGNLVGRMIADHLARRLPGIVGADRRWSYAFVENVADGHVAAIERGRIGVDYRLCGENVPQGRVFELVRALTGRDLPRRIPYWAADAAGFACEAAASWLRRPPPLTRGAVEILRHEWAYDSADAERELGYSVLPLADGIRRTLLELQGPRTSPS